MIAKRKRGRPSAADQMVATMNAPVAVVTRQRPPHDLTDEEVEIWVGIVDDNPADWFSPSTSALLAQYCRHVVASRRIAEMIERWSFSPELIVSYLALLKAQKAESASIAMLATKMRISQQAITNHRGNKQQKAALPPWER